MTYRTHAYLGAMLYPAICEAWNVKLSRKRLIEGSIKPDMTSLFLRHPHFWKYSRSYVFKKIRKLSRKRLKADKSHKKFSEELGIVLHYVADFFTSVHNITPNRILEHIAYEDILHDELLRTVDAESVRNSFRLAASYSDIEALLRRQHERYKPTRDDPSADIREILVACAAVTSHIMDAVLSGESRAVPEAEAQKA
jgi:hypothetical protein